MSQTGETNFKKAFTFIEVLMAVVILSIGIVGVLRAYALSLGALEVTQDIINTVGLAKQKMADVEQTMIEQGGISAGSAQGSFEGDYKGYTWQSQVTTRTTEPLYKLAITVSQEAGSRQLTLVTYAQNKDYKPAVSE